MMIDFSAFIGKFPYWENKYAEPTGQGLIKLMDRDNIKWAVVLSLRSVFYDDESGNKEVFEAIDRYPERFMASITINPYSKINNRAYIKECRDAGAKVLKLFPFHHAYPLQSLDDTKLDNLVDDAASMGYCISLPLRLFMNWYFMPLPFASAAQFILKHKDCKIVLDGFNYGEVGSILDLAEQAPNLYFCTSGLSLMNGIEILEKAVGAERILAGTCAPLQIPACGSVKVEKALIKQSAKKQILGDNAAKLLEL